MANMSYCRFENTEADLRDCVETLEYDELPTSRTERQAVRDMADLCREYLDAFKRIEVELDKAIDEDDDEDED